MANLPTIGVYVHIVWESEQRSKQKILMYTAMKEIKTWRVSLADQWLRLYTFNVRHGQKKKKKRIKQGDLMVSGWRGCPSKMGNQKSDLFREAPYRASAPSHKEDMEVMSKPSVPTQCQGRASLGEEGC